MRPGVAALAAAALAVAAALVAAACDRVVNLTPFYDGGPDPDGPTPDTVHDVGSPVPDAVPHSDALGLDVGAVGDATPAVDSNPAADAVRLDSGLGLDGGL
jgi:hypothetical protein